MPASDPQVVIYVVVDSAKGWEIWGSTVAVPVFAEVAKQVARILNLKSDKYPGSGFKACTRPLPDLEAERLEIEAEQKALHKFSLFPQSDKKKNTKNIKNQKKSFFGFDKNTKKHKRLKTPKSPQITAKSIAKRKIERVGYVIKQINFGNKKFRRHKF